MKKYIFTISIVLAIIGGIVFSQEKRELKYFGINFRDPFLSFLPEEKPKEIEEKVNPPDLKLQGIVWGSANPKVIINGIVLGKGEKILGAEILDIRRDGVEFVYKGHNFFIDRVSGIIKEKIKAE